MNNHTLSNFVVVFVALFAISCERNELPVEQVVAAPIFEIQATANGQSLNLNIGEGASNVIPDGEFQESEIPVLKTTLHTQSCEELCTGSLEFQFSGNENYSSGDLFASHFETGAYPLTDDLTFDLPIVEVNLTSSAGIYAIYSQGFPDSFPLFEGFPEVQAVLFGGYTFTYELSSTDCTVIGNGIFDLVPTDLCEGAFNITLDGSLLNLPLAIDISEINLHLNGAQFPLTSGTVIDLSTLSTWSTIAENLISIELIFEEECFVSYIIVMDPSYSETVEFGMSTEEYGLITPTIPNGVSLTYQSTDNIIYRSFSGSTDELEIMNIEVYENDPLGREAYTFECAGEVTLVSPTGELLALDISNARIPVIWE